jgi:polar amino acid transport system substrate-binding protein
LKLVVDENFAPYSFVATSGAPAGLSVELALAACAEIKVKCSVSAKPFGDVFPSLRAGKVDAVITGPRLDDETLKQSIMTRPYFRMMARFATATASSLKDAGAASLSGKKIGVVKDTIHARWLEAYYGDAEIIPFDTLAMAGDALRSGKVDAIFGDNLSIVYWIEGEASKSCCRPLGGAYSDFDFFSRNLSFLFRRDQPQLRAAFDYGLDMAQKNGATARIIKAYLPLSPW